MTVVFLTLAVLHKGGGGYGGLGVSLQTTKSGGLRVDEVPSEFGFDPRRPR